jgi:hypothetical protein
MCIYCKTKNYRKIYENHHGPIPKEPDGRSFEIHHRDGNHSNNNPSNLVALTLQEHYDIHYAQGDYSACLLMKGQRMEKTTEELSELSSKRAKAMYKKGNHPFQDREWARERTKKSVEQGTHNFLGGKIQSRTNRRRVEEGTHHWLGAGDVSSKRQQEKVNFGTHAWLRQADGSSIGGKTSKRLIQEGTHHLLGPDSPTQKQWTCIHCGKSGKGLSNYNRWHGDNCSYSLVSCS